MKNEIKKYNSQWIPITEKIPQRPEYDWVLVKFILSGGSEGIPKVAEYINGKWRCDLCNDIEKDLDVKVVAWFDMQTIVDMDCDEECGKDIKYIEKRLKKLEEIIKSDKYGDRRCE